MRSSRLTPLVALAAAGVLWGMTVPLTKVALTGMGPGWLAAARFAAAALPLAWISRHHLRAALTPRVAIWGALGYGVMLIVQNAGIARTSVSHAALITAAAPVAVMLLTVVLRRGSVRPAGWIGAAATLVGVALIAADGAGAATTAGDALVLVSVLLSAVFMIAQPRTLAGRNPLAVTAVQFGSAAPTAALLAILGGERVPALPHAMPLTALAVLVVVGTLAPFALFAYAQGRVTPATAGVFLNLEPLVGAAIGVVAFANPFGPAQVTGGVAILGGILLAALPGRRPPRRTRFPARWMRAPRRHGRALQRRACGTGPVVSTPSPFAADAMIPGRSTIDGSACRKDNGVHIGPTAVLSTFTGKKSTPYRNHGRSVWSATGGWERPVKAEASHRRRRPASSGAAETMGPCP